MPDPNKGQIYIDIDFRALQESMQQLDNAFRTLAEQMAEMTRPLVESFEKWGVLPTERTFVVEDPADWPRDRCSLLQQTVAIFKHEFWTAIGEPQKSPGATWVPRR